MTRERIDDLLNLVVECKGIEDINVSLEVDKYGEYITVWTSKPEDGINMTIYKSGTFSTGFINNEVQAITDPALVKAEAHLRRLLNG